ncbi:hypothetical protein OUZ56_005294 [Daphnia magna]|uniref:Uncharacterized protein n=1 Tax=Daphnia magna TaxID=35525 RepID=A0ABQ9YSR6_9CRUS|nr:hypothetical protein OUZ56_005294 [Daphnia magna]
MKNPAALTLPSQPIRRHNTLGSFHAKSANQWRGQNSVLLKSNQKKPGQYVEEFCSIYKKRTENCVIYNHQNSNKPCSAFSAVAHVRNQLTHLRRKSPVKVDEDCRGGEDYLYTLPSLRDNQLQQGSVSGGCMHVGDCNIAHHPFTCNANLCREKDV